MDQSAVEVAPSCGESVTPQAAAQDSLQGGDAGAGWGMAHQDGNPVMKTSHLEWAL